MLCMSAKSLLRPQNYRFLNSMGFQINSRLRSDKDVNMDGRKPTTFEKYILVWTKKYRSVAEVPRKVSVGTLRKAFDWARIKFSIYLCIAAGFIYIFMAYSGKQAQKRGESIQKMNIEWHKEQDAKTDK